MRVLAILFGFSLAAPAAANQVSPPPPPAFGETITVTASRSDAAPPTGASGAALDRGDLETEASPVLDRALRRVPGFTLFRRSDSRFAHPTAQGVSLRGTGASGAGRALVLADGVPANDPFGGWVQWARVPRAAIERVEVLRGGGGEVWGGAAMGGVVQILRGPDDRSGVRGDVAVGTLGSGDGSLFAVAAGKVWSASVAVDAFATDGYVAIPAALRGPVDRELASEHLAAELALRRRSGASESFVRYARYEEDRENGTEVQVNATEVEMLSAGSSSGSASHPWAIRVWSTRQELRSTFSAIAPDRASERRVRVQRVPAESWGAGGEWRSMMGRHLLIAGGDLRRAEATSRERVFTPGGSFTTAAGGSQLLGGAFVEAVLLPRDDVATTLAVRGDGWRSRSRSAAEPERTRIEISPRASAVWEAADGFRLVGSAWGAFRPPTINELVRGFRVGDVVTLPNGSLAAEKTLGVEGGVDLVRGGAEVRARLFRMEVEQAIANVTIGVEEGVITRMRQNVGLTRSSGIEIDGRWIRPWGEVAGGILVTDARVRRFAEERSLEGNRIPQVPTHQATARATRTIGGTRLSAEVRWSGPQYDDDENRFELDSYTVVDLHLSHALRRRLTLFAAAENVLGEHYEVGRTPIPTLGPGRIVRIGVRVDAFDPW